MNFLTPDVAYLLLISGTVVLIFAILTPGTGLLEITALFLLLGAGYSATQLAVNAWAIALWIVGAIFFGLSVWRRRRATVWLVLALVVITVGSVFIFRSPNGGSAVSPWLALITSVLVVGFGWIIARKVLEAEERPPAHSLDRLIGAIGEARTPINPEGTVYVGGEDWTARSDSPIPAGAAVRVVGRSGLILKVEEVKLPNSHPTQ